MAACALFLVVSKAWVGHRVAIKADTQLGCRSLKIQQCSEQGLRVAQSIAPAVHPKDCIKSDRRPITVKVGPHLDDHVTCMGTLLPIQNSPPL